MPKAVLVIPCYNEAARLDRGEMLRLARARPGLDLLFVDDGSKDGTVSVIRELQAEEPGIGLLELGRNVGKGEAVRLGLLHASRGEAAIVGYADADLATPVDELVRLHDIALESERSVVLGSRIQLLGYDVERHRRRHYLGRVFATLASIALRLPVYDTQCGAKFFRRNGRLDQALSEPFTSRWAFDVELLGRLLSSLRRAGESGNRSFLEVPLRRWKDAPGSKLGVGSMLRAGLDLGGMLVARFAHPHPWRAALFTYLAVMAVLLSPIWTVSVSPIWDAFEYFYPAFAYQAQALHLGRLPLWDPFTNCGLPFHADPQAPTLNPVAIVLGLVVPRPALGFMLFWVLHWIWAGCGMFLIIRALRGRPSAALVAGLTYALSGFFVSNAEHTSWLVTAAWLPWAVGAAHLAVSRGQWGFALLAGCAMAFSAMGGYPALVGFGMFFTAVWLAFAFLGPWARFESRRPTWPRSALRVATTVATMAVLLGLAWAPVLHAFFVTAGQYTVRSGPIDAAVAMSAGSFTWRESISLLAPGFVGLPVQWSSIDVSMRDAFIGLLALPLAILPLLIPGASRRRWWLLAVAALMTLVSAGIGGPLRSLLHELVPTMKYMRHNAGYRLFWLLPLCASAGMGLSLVASSQGARAKLRALLLPLGVALLGAGAVVAQVLMSTEVPLGPSLVLRLLLPPMIVVGSAYRLLRPGLRQHRSDRMVPALLVSLLVFDLGVHLHVTAPTVYAKRFYLRDAEKLAVNPDPLVRRLPDQAGPHFNAHQLTRTPVAQGYVTMTSTGFNDLLAPGRFMEVLEGHRYWLTPSAKLPTDPDGALRSLASQGAGSPVDVFVERRDSALDGIPVAPGTFGVARITQYRPERVELLVEVPGTTPAMLASTERFAPGWIATLDDKPAVTERVNFFFRGTVVPSGTHRVAWRYVPPHWKLLVTIMVLTLLAALSGGCLMLRGRWLDSLPRPRRTRLTPGP
jgi:glycosyltransferase involved in cell wall biosynthesis